MNLKKFFKLPLILAFASGASFLTSCSFLERIIENVIGDEEETTHNTYEVKPNYPNVDEISTFKELLPITDKEVYITPGISEKDKEATLKSYNATSINDYSEIKEYKRKNTSKSQYYLEYKDKHTNVIFRDFSYHVDEQGKRRYLLGKRGLVILAQEFKRKIPFGSEIYDFNSVNINDFEVINDKANGLYIPLSKKMYINGSTYAEKNFSIYEIIGGMMPTIFHEYMHHWATIYAESALVNDAKVDVANGDNIEERKTTLIYYDPTTTADNVDHNHGVTQFWNAYFASKFYKLLNFDVDKKASLKFSALQKLGVDLNDLPNFLYTRLSLNDIWRISNELEVPDHLKNNPPANLSMHFSPSGSFSVTKSKLKYTFSLTELVPREYSKYAFESYFSIRDENKSYNNVATKKPTLNWFGIRYFSKDSNGKEVKVFSPSGNAEDWSKTYLNNFDSLRRQYWFQNGIGKNEYDDEDKFNATVFPNSVFDISAFRYKVQGYPNYLAALPSDKTRLRSVEFYKMFLETMGYGKTISQIYYQNAFASESAKNVAIDKTKVTNIKFTGFVKTDEVVTGIAVKNKSGIYKQSPFDYSASFSFFGHKNYDEGATLFKEENNKITVSEDRKKQIDNRLYPKDAGYADNYLSYITRDWINVDEDGMSVYLWNDLNNDGKASEDELLDREISLPKQRAVSTSRSTNYSDRDFKKYYVEKIDGKTILKGIK
ncbi:MYPU_1760 family metalloprotease [Mycoplasmopsis edwardii]|uniref:Uncharacterized protein n=1 Tax=Mycoplasmopsis edwardii TaxID=53558 RepID=A0ACD4PK04_9BACT|nr:hypothetical protein [Mycoplasmopsis edwardii]WBP84131.1 hypothetical protein Me_995_000082 [Mycoplasmopsis edwardii]